MEIIRKRICLEKSRSRVNGLLPFIHYNDQNAESPLTNDGSSWGNFPADFEDGNGYTFLDGEVTRTMELLRRYNIIMGIIRNGIFVERIDDLSCAAIGTDNRYKVITETDTLENLIQKCAFESGSPVSIDSVTKGEDGTYDIPDGKKYAVIITDYETYEKFDGVKFAKDMEGRMIGNKQGSKIPYINVPILLKQECHDMGVMTDYIEDTGYLEKPTDFSYEARGGVAFDIKEKKSPDGKTELSDEFKELNPTRLNGLEYEVNSLLTSLRSPDYAMADEETLPGIWQTYDKDGGQMFKCTYFITTSTIHATKKEDEEGNISWDWEEYTNSIPNNTLSIHKGNSVRNDSYDEDGNVTAKTQTCKYWQYDPVSIKLDCADDEAVAPGETKYQSITIFGTITSRLKGKTPNNGDFYYFLVRYKNDASSPMLIPYEEKSLRNIRVINEEKNVYIADWVEHINPKPDADGIITGDTIEFEYVIQRRSDDANTGILYKESYMFEPCAVTSVTIDGVDNVPIYYQKIDFDSSKKTIYSSDYNLYRSGNTSTITQMTAGDIWRSGITYDDTGETLNAPVFKDEFLMGSAFAVKSSVDVEISRGNAAAFERHLILTECNTFEDVENYRNNYFNIE